MSVKRYLATLPSQEGKTIVVTGANSGIGLQTAKHLATLGARVILACRNEGKAQTAMQQILQTVPTAQLEFLPYDQASPAAIRQFAALVEERPLDGLVLNAGICGAEAGRKTEQGDPLIFGTNFLGVRYLVTLLKEKLLREGTRVVFVSSLAGRLAKPQPITSFTTGSANRQYGYSKLCLSIFACQCMKEGLQVVLVHPGVSGTNILFGQDSSLPRFLVDGGRRLLDHFPNKGEKPGLMSVAGICVSYRMGLYLRPAWPLGLFGLPGAVRIPERFWDLSMIAEDQALPAS